MAYSTTPRISTTLLFAVLCLLVTRTQTVLGKNLKIIQDDWNYHSNGLFEPVYVRMHRIPNSFSSSRKERSVETEDDVEPTHMLVIRSQNRTLYVELEPATDLLGPSPVLSNLSHATGFFKESRCLFRGKILNQGQGRAAISLCQGEHRMSGLLVTDDGAMVLRPIEEENEVKRRRRRRSFVDGATLHTLRSHHSLHPSFCGTQHRHSRHVTGEGNDPENLVWRFRRASAHLSKKVIETAVFADSDLYQIFKKKHGESEAIEQLTNMILAIMNEVQLIYMYDSMKMTIKIVIVKLQILKPEDDAPDKKKGDIDQYLDTFCAWQSQKVAAEGLPGHWDHAILLTGMNLFKEYEGKKNDKVLGLAWVNGMCRPTYSCTINEGKDFEAAYVIAHELAHSLGVLHDGTNNNCDPDKYIMSDKTGPGKISWSDCSNQYMQRYFNRGHARCLDGEAEPATVRLRLGREIRPPGEKYGPEEQCHLAMGPRYKPYTNSQEPFNNICRELWCYTGTWATPAHPALDGSHCARGRRCKQGLCQPERQIDGNDLDVSADGNATDVDDETATSGSRDEEVSQPAPDGNGNSNDKPRGFFNAVSTFFRDVLKKVQGFFKTTG